MNKRIELNQYQAKISRSPKENIPEEPCLRVYNHSPDRICLQIRCEKSYASTTLNVEQIKALTVALKLAMDALAGAEKKDTFNKLAPKPQQQCDHGLFSDDHKQTELFK